MTKSFLHVGCGGKTKAGLKGFNTPDWREIRFDIDENVQPDIIGTMTDMAAVGSDSVDAVYSSHNLEHVFPHEVPVVLAEFRRVLKPDGFVVLTCPDLQSVCKVIGEGKLVEPLYVSPAGPISPIDVLYGFRKSMAAGNLYMAHKGGFTIKTLVDSFTSAGFRVCIGGVQAKAYALWVVAFKDHIDEDEARVKAQAYLP